MTLAFYVEIQSFLTFSIPQCFCLLCNSEEVAFLLTFILQAFVERICWSFHIFLGLEM